jgi:cysteine desulfurase
MRTIYFDHNATTPLDPLVRQAMLPFLGDVWGNPSSIHQLGRQARAALDEAHERAARVLDCRPSELVFTSGGTESINLAILGTARALASKGRHLITSSIEHHAVLHCFDYLATHEGFQLTKLPADREGRISPDDLRRSLRRDTILASIMAANNEIGTLQPVAELGAICRQAGVAFHTDAVQWFGKEPVACVEAFNADLVSACAHKFYGPKGAGLLYIRSPLKPKALMFGGPQELERRPGTENLAATIGLVSALEHFIPCPVFARAALQPLTAHLIDLADVIPHIQFIGSRTHCLSNTASFLVSGTDTASLIAGLDLEGVCASGGSACSTGSSTRSHILDALGFNPATSHALVRFSLGRDSTATEVEAAIEALRRIVARSQPG